MVPNTLPVSDLAIPSVIEPPAIRVRITRIPFDDYFHLKYVKDGRETSEELLGEETLKWFTDHMHKPASREAGLVREEAIEKALDESWNFYHGCITIPGDVYEDPIKPFPQYQPKV